MSFRCCGKAKRGSVGTWSWVRQTRRRLRMGGGAERVVRATIRCIRFNPKPETRNPKLNLKQNPKPRAERVCGQ